MISLTAQVVLASLFTSIINSTVKTPYLKLIDLWFSIIITIVAFVNLCQVIVNSILHYTRLQRMIRENIFRKEMFGIELKINVTKIIPINPSNGLEVWPEGISERYRDRQRAKFFNKVAGWFTIGFTLSFTVIYVILSIPF